LRSVLLAALGLASAAYTSEESKTSEASKKAQKFVQNTIVLDFYASPYGVGWNNPEQLYEYITRAQATGITGASATLAATYFTWEQFQREQTVWRETILDAPFESIFVHSVEDIERAHEQGAYAFVWNSQTSSILNGDLSRVATLRAMGVGSMQLVYNDTYRAGDGVIAAWHNRDRGLTDWGKQLVDQMVRHGIVIDLSYTDERTATDIVNYVNANHPGTPVIYSHSLPAGLYANTPEATEGGCYRNITDEQAKAAAATGGVVSPTFTEWMMDGIWPDDISPQQAAEMIDYYVKLVGVDHVGIATDGMFTLSILMGFVGDNAAAYNDEGYMVRAHGCGELAKILPAVTDALWAMGYSNDDLRKIYGGNTMRVYRQVWK